MLLNVHVKNLALIEDVDVYFGDGLNILTGETGAGKSIIIGSINIALGGKVPKDIIRKNAEYGFVELIFAVSDLVKEKLKEKGIFIEEENQVVISRKITNGRSIIKINGETVASTLLKEVAGLLLDVHGQHDHESLLKKSRHLEILDSFIGEKGEKLKTKVGLLYLEYRRCKEKLKEFDISDEARKREMDFLQFEINEIEEASLVLGEDTELEEKQKAFSSATKILEVLQNVSLIMQQDSNSVSANISSCAGMLSRISDINDKTSSLYDCIMDLDSICQDFVGQLDTYIDNIDFDEERVNYVYERLNTINKLKMKHGNSIEQIFAKKEEFENKLNEYADYEQRLIEVKESLSNISKEYEKEAEKLTSLRKTVAKNLSKDITEVLKTLNFNYVAFDTAFEKTKEYTSSGMDDVCFMISTNVGEDIKPLSDVASGGELSRIMLGIKTILAHVDNIDTLIFDEIDTGISGRTAQMVAEKMKIIAKNHQIICITHLPQIAAMADDHYLIEKKNEENSTKTEINKLNYDESVMELSRMLGGAVISEVVVGNAREMKKMAKQEK